MRGFLPDITFIVVDVETTGLNASHNRITEIALVKVLNGEIVSEFSSLVNPEQFIPPYISALTGITNELVYDKPKFEDVIPNIRTFINGSNGTKSILAGHNINFDYKFLNESFNRAGAENLSLSTLCTCRLARRLERKLHSKSLGSLSKYFRIKVRRRHRALDDAKAAAYILINFLDRLINEFAIETLDEVLSFQYKKIYGLSKIPKKLKRIKLDLQNIPARSGVYYMKNKKDIILYIGKARNLKERLSSYFYHNISHTNKIKKLIRQVYKIGYEVTPSELSALILESRLIKQHNPKFNSAMKRYRKYPFIKIDEKNRFPRAEKTYEVNLDGAKYYG
ncbi:MAG: exonuclease domain-containing protein, partial [Ignavibacteria bacterium]